ncbi:Hypothetical protein MVR_LOCUS311 [uncultured virus]|nr:Hypothetical protein MVR_LOCUS311 [uncultured virus]
MIEYTLSNMFGIGTIVRGYAKMAGFTFGVCVVSNMATTLTGYGDSEWYERRKLLTASPITYATCLGTKSLVYAAAWPVFYTALIIDHKSALVLHGSKINMIVDATANKVSSTITANPNAVTAFLNEVGITSSMDEIKAAWKSFNG